MTSYSAAELKDFYQQDILPSLLILRKEGHKNAWHMKILRAVAKLHISFRFISGVDRDL